MPNAQFVASVYTLYNYLISHTSIPLCLSELSLEETAQIEESTHHQKKIIIRLIPYNNLKFYLIVRSVYGRTTHQHKLLSGTVHKSHLSSPVSSRIQA